MKENRLAKIPAQVPLQREKRCHARSPTLAAEVMDDPRVSDLMIGARLEQLLRS
jgi:hypothetical protein